MIIRKLNELRESYEKQQGNYNDITAISINIEKEIETINKAQEEMKNTISKLKNTVEKNTQKEQEKEKRFRKNEEVFREMQDNMKYSNIHIIGISEGQEEDQGIEN